MSKMRHLVSETLSKNKTGAYIVIFATHNGTLFRTFDNKREACASARSLNHQGFQSRVVHQQSGRLVYGHSWSKEKAAA